MMRSTRALRGLAQKSRTASVQIAAVPRPRPMKSTPNSALYGTIAGPTFPRSQREAALKPVQFVLRTQYSTKPPVPPTHGDPAFEKKVGQEKLESHPDQVSTQSSVRHVFEQSQTPDRDHDMTAELKDDVRTVKETFALTSVPRESYFLGLAGTLPYLATSLSTVYLSWNLNTPWPTNSNFLNSFLMTHDNANHLLHLLEPIQIGYGAVIISFLGAIHWGLEYAEKSPSRPRTTFRYAMGVVAPVIAWPTMVLPIQFALTAQFLSFVGLYFADARATARGWAPHWYGTYRFVLTAVVGAAIFISLVGRAKIGDTRARLSTEDLRETLVDKHDGEHYNKHWEELEKEEKERIKKQKEEEAKKKKAEEKKNKGKKGDERSKAQEKGGEGEEDDSGAGEDKKAEESKEDKKGDTVKKGDTAKNEKTKSDDDAQKSEEGQKTKDDKKENDSNPAREDERRKSSDNKKVDGKGKMK